MFNINDSIRQEYSNIWKLFLILGNNTWVTETIYRKYFILITFTGWTKVVLLCW